MADGMSPVELLRSAAARLREIGAKASVGPWETGDDGLVWADRLGDPVSGSTEPEDATWIALVHPGLAEPLAELLEHAASLAEVAEPGWQPTKLTAYALRVARVLLGVPE